MYARRCPSVFFAQLFAVSLFAAAAPQPEKQGRILIAEGDVQVSYDQAAIWKAIRPGEAVFDTNIVKTGRQSRCAILLIDETQLRLNAYTTMEIRKVKRGGKVLPAAAGRGAAETTLWMEKGEAWARSKNTGRSLAIETPAATAAIRGTEVDLRVSGEVSEIVVVEGLVDLYNPSGSVTLRGGEGGRAEVGKAPQKMAVVNPEDAVQWVLHYPEPESAVSTLAAVEAAALAERLRQNPADATSRMELITYHVARGEWSDVLDLVSYPATPADAPAYLRACIQALTALGRDVDEELKGESQSIAASAPQLIVLADFHLRYGDPAQAKKELGEALELDPRNQDALALTALIAITQNDVDKADELVRRSLDADKDHYATQLVASKVAQARFNLDSALEHASAARRIWPDGVEAAASAAEILFGSGRTADAWQAVSEMLTRHPDNARLLTVSGFISLGLDHIARAEEAFSKAIASEPEAPDAHLGLGLCQFYRGKRDEGLVEMLTASFLAPNISLYESYLGKAYFEERRFTEAFAALDTAKRLDPRDPTPHLYSGLFKRDLNRHGQAIEELQQAIAKNDNRAVYRSRLLLDRDQATRNVSLAQIYSEVGFSALGAYHATKSLELDFGNSSAHLFAAGALIDLPDRTTASSSELLVARLLLPVNQNAFNTFNEYTSLLSAPGTSGRLRGDGGNHGYGVGNASINGGNNRAAYFGFVTHSTDNGFIGPNSDVQETIWNGLAKVALGSSQSLLFDSYGLEAGEGDPGGVVVVLDTDSSAVPIRIVKPDVPDLDDRIKATIEEHFIGYHNNSISNHNFLAAASLSKLSYKTRDPDYYFQPDYYDPSIWDYGRRTTDETEGVGFQAQHQFSAGPHQLLYGGEILKERDEAHAFYFADHGPYAGDEGEIGQVAIKNRYSAAYGRYIWRSKNDSTVSAGFRYDHLDLEDMLLPATRRNVKESRWSPEFGVRWQVAPRVSLRAAAFRHLAGHSGARIAPQLLAGFAVLRAESAGTQRDEGNVAVDYLLPHEGLLSFSYFHRKVGAPVYSLDADDNFLRSVGEFKVDGGRVDYNARLTSMLTLFNELQVRRIATSAFDQNDFQEVLSLQFIHPRGWFFYVSGTYLRQTFEGKRNVLDLPKTSVFFLDASMKKELARKRARLGFNVRNLFDSDFNVVVEGLSVTQRYPTREASAFFELVF